MTRRFLLGVLLVASLAFANIAGADQPQGLSPQTIKLPNGPASIKGLGESFAPNPFTGTGSFSIPVDVAPAQLAPQLSVNYAAGGGKGLLGLSFDLPLFKIIRTTAKGAPKYDETDRFAVVGPGLNDELVRVASDIPRYRLKNESAYALFERDAQRDQWVVRLPGNRVMYLGETDASREQASRRTFAWFVEREADAFGHQISYTYRRDLGRLYPLRIDYALHAVDSAKNRIDFVTEPRPDPFTDYSYGAAIRTQRRISRIIVSQGARTLRTYLFTYQSSELHSLLESVQMVGEGNPGEAGVLTTPPLRFKYVRHGEVDARYGTMGGAVPTSLLASGTAVLEDVNADGLPDFLVGERANYRYYENIDGRRFSPTETRLSLSPDCTLGAPETLVADIDGDGFRDVVCSNGSSVVYFAGGDIRYSDGTFVGYRSPKALGGLGGLPLLSSATIKVADLNKDGKSDFLYEGNGTPVAILNQGNGTFLWSNSSLTLPNEVALSAQSVALMDWNGDGELDFVRNEVGGDLGSARVWFGTGGGQFVWGQEVAGPKGRRDWYDWMDVNRDGQTDLVEHTGSSVRYFLNNGDGALRQSVVAVNDAPPSYDVRKKLFADLNGNGTTDIVWVTPSLEIKYLDLFGSASTYLLSRIDNGLGQVTDIAYGTSTDFLVAAKLKGERWKTPLPSPVPVITELYTTDSFDVLGLEPNDTRVAYRYDHGYYDAVEREFRGFARVITTEPGDAYAETRVTETWHHVGRNLTSGADEEALKGRAYLTYVMNDRGELYSTSRVRWERRWLCREDLPSDFLPVLPLCGASSSRDQRKDSLVAVAVSTDVIEAMWEKGIARTLVDTTTAPSYQPGLTGSHVEYDAWGRPIVSLNYGRIAIDSYRPQEDSSCTGPCITGGGERDEVAQYTEYLDVANDSSWLPGLPVCKATVGLNVAGVAASWSAFSQACRAASPGEPGFTSLSDAYSLISFTRSYFDGLPLRQAKVGLTTRNEAWFNDGLGGAPSWQTEGNITYNAHGLPTDFYDARNDRREVTYDANSTLFPVSERYYLQADGQSAASSLVFTAEYDPGFGVITRAVNPDGVQTGYRYDGLGRLTHVLGRGEEPDTAGISYRYTPGSSTYPVSVTETRERDPATGRVALSYLYSDGGGRTRLTKVPAESPYGFVASGYAELSSRGAKAAVYATFASNRLGMEKPPDGTPANRTFFDGMDRPVEMTVAPTQGSLSVRSRKRYMPFELQDFDQRDTYENGSSLPTVTRFDGAGRVRSVTKQVETAGTAPPVVFRIDYDAGGRIVAFANSAGVRGTKPLRTFAYDSLGRLRRVVEDGLGVITYGYDAVGNRTSREDEVGSESSVFGSFGRVLARTYHANDGATPDYSHFYFYDAPDPNGPLAGVAANAMGRVAWVQYRVGRRDFAYDREGNTVTVVEGLWDGVSPIENQVRTEFRKTTDYDALGDKVAVHLPGDFHTWFSRNARGSISGVSSSFGVSGARTAVWSDIRYDVGGRAEQAANANGNTSCWRHDSEGLLTGVLVGRTADSGWSCADLDDANYDSVRGKGLVHLRYFRAYDDLITQVMDLGRATKQPRDRAWEVGAPDRSATYRYDRLQELTEARTSLGTYSYRYDDIQNLIEQTEATLATGATKTTRFVHGEARVVGSTRNASPNAVTSVCADASCTTKTDLYYDRAGRLASYKGYDLKYDPQGRLASAAKTGGGSVTFYYDHAGTLKVSISRSPEGAIRVDRNVFEDYEERNGDKLWSIDGPAGRVEVAEMAGLWVDNYLLDSLNAYVAALGTTALPPRPVPIEYADLDNDGNSNFDAQDLAVALAANRNPTNKRVGASKRVYRYYVRDAIQSSTHVMDSAGELVGVAHYAPYGATQTHWGLEPSWGYAGTRWPDLRETGLIHYGARVYAPELGHWTSPDRHIGESPKLTASQRLDTNLYGYSRNNPATYRDPDGNEPVTLTVAAGVWLAKAAAEGAGDTVMDYAIAKLGGEEFGVKDGLISFGAGVGMALIGAGAAAHGRKLFRLTQLVMKNGDKAKALLGPLRKMLSVAGDKFGAAGKKLQKALDDVAAKMKGSACKGCFVSGTMVATALGPVPIEQVEVGDRVLTTAPATTETEVDQSWLRISAEVELEGRPGDLWRVELLRSSEWLAEHSTGPGTIWIELSGAATVEARILTIQAAQAPSTDVGRVVTATYDHLSAELIELRLVGSESVIQGTWDHPFFSADRGTWVMLGDIAKGERLETAAGVAVVESKTTLDGTFRVYNLEVEGEHEYFVTSSAVRVHNCGDGAVGGISAKDVADAALASGKPSGAASVLRVGDHVFTGVSSEVVEHSDEVTGVLMSTAKGSRAPWHGGCSEIVCLDKAFKAGVDPKGGVMETVNIGVSGAGHGTPKVTCPTCVDALQFFGVSRK